MNVVLSLMMSPHRFIAALLLTLALPACDSKKALEEELENLRIELSDLGRERRDLDHELSAAGKEFNATTGQKLATYKRASLAQQVEKLEADLEIARAQEKSATDIARNAKERLEQYRRLYGTGAN